MNGKKARQIRKQVYGDRDYRDRKYFRLGREVRADRFREKYQEEKKK